MKVIPTHKRGIQCYSLIHPLIKDLGMDRPLLVEEFRHVGSDHPEPVLMIGCHEIDREDAQLLIKHLQHWIDTGGQLKKDGEEFLADRIKDAIDSYQK